jgi:hypothetical protein
MNLEWNCLTSSQRAALAVLGQGRLCSLPGEIGEQLYNLGLAEMSVEGLYCITATGSTVLPTTIH